MQWSCQAVCPRNWALTLGEVQLAKEDEACFDPHCNGLFKACFVGNIKVDIIVDVDMVGHCSWCASGINDTCINGIGDHTHEERCGSGPERALLLNLIEAGKVLLDNAVVVEGVSVGLRDCLPVGWAKVTPKAYCARM